MEPGFRANGGVIMENKPTNKKAVEDLARKGDRIGAMKEYMAQTRAGLKESKDAVDKMIEELKKKQT
jgi:ribosomal protein L7/L12